MAVRASSVRARVGLVVVVGSYALLVLIAGAPNSPLIPALPAKVGPAGWTIRGADVLGFDRLSRTELTVVSIVVLVVAVAAFGVVVLEAWRGRVTLWPVVAATGISLALAVAAPVLLSRDVFSYAVYGRISALHHANPYVVPPSAYPSDPFVRVASPEWVHTRSVYGPAFTLLSGAVARAWSRSVGGTLLAFKVIAAASLGTASLVAAWIAARRRPGSEALAAAAVGINPVLVIHTVGGAHNDALLAVLLVVALAMAVGVAEPADERTEDAGPPSDLIALGVTAALTGAVLVKSVALPFLVWWIWWIVHRAAPNQRPVKATAHLALTAALGVAAFWPFAAGGRTLRALLSVASRQGWASGPGLVSRGARALGRAVAGGSTGLALETLATAVFVALFLVLFWRIVVRSAGSSDPLEGVTLWGAAGLLLALSGPYLLPWYAAWFVPLVALSSDAALSGVAFAVGGLLAVTGVPAEPGTTPHVWQAMMLGVHYGAAPVMLAMLAIAARRTVALTPRRNGVALGPVHSRATS